ncbi:hypothetical protein, partial [Azotobacter chroococcum]
RCRTSGEYFVADFMAPSSQRLEPPGNPGRFRLYLPWISDLQMAGKYDKVTILKNQLRKKKGA